MANPWEDYAPQQTKNPWDDYKAPTKETPQNKEKTLKETFTPPTLEELQQGFTGSVQSGKNFGGKMIVGLGALAGLNTPWMKKTAKEIGDTEEQAKLDASKSIIGGLPLSLLAFPAQPAMSATNRAQEIRNAGGSEAEQNLGGLGAFGLGSAAVALGGVGSTLPRQIAGGVAGAVGEAYLDPKVHRATVNQEMAKTIPDATAAQLLQAGAMGVALPVAMRYGMGIKGKTIPKEGDLPPVEGGKEVTTTAPKVSPEVEASQTRLDKAINRYSRVANNEGASAHRKDQYRQELIKAQEEHVALLKEQGHPVPEEPNIPESIRNVESPEVVPHDPSMYEPKIPDSLLARGFEEVPVKVNDTPPPQAPDLSLVPKEVPPVPRDPNAPMDFEQTQGQTAPELPMDHWQGKEADFADLNRPIQDNPLLSPRNTEYTPQERGMGQGEFSFGDSHLKQEGASNVKYAQNPDNFGDLQRIPVEAFANAKHAGEALNVILDHTSDPNIRNIAMLFTGHPYLKDMAFNVHPEGTVHVDPELARTIGGKSFGVARQTGGKININLSHRGTRPDIAVHEVLHGLTMAAIKRNPKIEYELQSLGHSITGTLKDIASNMDRVRAAGRTWDGGKSNNAYRFWDGVTRDIASGKIDADEVLAYGITSPAFREILSGLDVNGKPLRDLNTRRSAANNLARPKQLTMWDKVLDIFSRLFGNETRAKQFKESLEAYHRQHRELVNPKTAIDQLTEHLNTLLADSSGRGITAFKEHVPQEAKGGLKQIQDPVRREIELGKNPDLTNPEVLSSLTSEPDIDATPFRNSMMNMGHRAQQLHTSGHIIPEIVFRKLSANIEDANSFVHRHIGQRTVNENSRGMKQKRNPDSMFTKLNDLSKVEQGSLINAMSAARRNGTTLQFPQGKVADAHAKLASVLTTGVEEYNKVAKQYGFDEIGVDASYLPSSSNRQYTIHVNDANGNFINTNFDGHSVKDINNMLPEIKALLKKEGHGDVTTRIVERKKYQLDNSLEQFTNFRPAGTATKLGKEYTGAYNVYDLPPKHSTPRLEENINNYSAALARGIATMKTRGEIQPLIDTLTKQGKTNLVTMLESNLAFASELGTKPGALDRSVIKTITTLTGNTVGDNAIRQIPRHLATVFQMSKVIPNIMQPLQAMWQIAAGSPLVAASLSKAKLGLDGAPLNGYAHMVGALSDLALNTPRVRDISKLMYERGLLDQNSHRSDFEDVGTTRRTIDKGMDWVNNIVAKPDQMAKLSTALMYDRLLSEAIPNKAERHQIVLAEVRRAVPDLDRWNRAPATFKAGMFSPVTSSLSNFWSHFYAQTMSTIKLATREEKKQYGPILATMLGVPLLAGVKASPLAPMMDAASGLINAFDANGDDQQEPFSDQLGRVLEDNTGLSQYGLAGATGYDLGKAILAPSPMMVPGAPAAWGATVAKDALAAVGSTNPNAVDKLALDVAPPLVSNMMKEQTQNERQAPEEASLTTNQPTGRDYRDQSVISKLGVPTVANQRSANMLQEQRRRDKVDQTVIKKVTGNIIARVQRGMDAKEPLVTLLENPDISDAVKIQVLDALPNTINTAIVSGKITAQQQRLLKTQLGALLNTVDVQQERGVQPQ